ncbi:helix-turn-helix domain-containing protein [Catenuloplanes atrovinosus]|uniref:AraC-like DNA-binding protein n=1 Tax=Catenuloplanes atrovinosus TaxID=137266 RepID=A0AAE3YQF9_9ACTN|nr:helix-turn-helix domain-containing protein [Catenuloplanes atrovinosus]MDR7275901.1 AraC-like DNA-binding protein [Catenuloplanes atrovinosus]
MDGPPQLHSIPVRGDARACEPRVGRAHPGLRRFVAGYAGFGRPGARPIAHRMLALPTTAIIVDVECGTTVVTGPRSAGGVCEESLWGHGVLVALTPRGVPALLGVPAAELAGRVLPLADVCGGRAAELRDRVAAAPSWAARRAVLDSLLRPRFPDDRQALADAAWRRLQRDGARVADVAAELDVGRRRLELACRAHLGQSPALIARIARFQRAIGLLAGGLPPAAAAARAGYADQPHLTREAGTLAGVTPGTLCAILQDVPPVRR